MDKLLTYLQDNFNEDELAPKLGVIAADAIAKVAEHQKRVLAIMPEYDLHDVSHLESVSDCIYNLIGVDKLKELSTFDIFLLLMGAYLHDCGMAPADWELNLYALTEGFGNFKIDEKSIKNDTKAPFDVVASIEFIREHKEDLYKNFTGDVKNWYFSPDSEDELVGYLSETLCTYQEFRNGYAKEFYKLSTQAAFDELNRRIRTDFIRTTHAKRSAWFVKNLACKYANLLTQPIAKRLFRDIADICQSHGEDLRFVMRLADKVDYTAGVSCNPQFAAQMLRLGDIIHFEAERAPLVIRNAMQFESAYSYGQWEMKDVGLSYNIANGEISYSAFCDSPHKYYHLMEYMSWVDDEIQNFRKLSVGWKNRYQFSIKDVNSKNIVPDENVFTPAKEKKFRLEQKKVIELLAGNRLYDDKFSGIRELYQNSLDACRCMISQQAELGRTLSGEIEFGIEEDEKGCYLYCLDNGIGMSKTVIEKYLLNIGSSYYKSVDFYRNIAKWNNSFTPISQFGIGILSCFMLGDRLEITTKCEEEDYHSFTIEGLNEYFYYNPTPAILKTKIKGTGTLVKIYLSNKIQTSLNNLPLKHLGLFLAHDNIQYVPMGMEDYLEERDVWSNHILKKLNDFVVQPLNNVNLRVRMSDNTVIPVQSKPFRLELGDMNFTEDDIPLLNFLTHNDITLHDFDSTYTEAESHLVAYPIELEEEGVCYKTLLSLPLAGMPRLKNPEAFFTFLNVEGSAAAVDGISVNNFRYDKDMYYKYLSRYGVISFNGAVRPQLSTSREFTVSMPDNLIEIMRNLVVKELELIFSTCKKHIEQHNLQNDITTCSLLWDYILKRTHLVDSVMINSIGTSELAEIRWSGVKTLVGKDMSIRQFLTQKTIVLKDYNYEKCDPFTLSLLMARCMQASSISIDDDRNITVKTDGSAVIEEQDKTMLFSDYLVRIDKSANVFQDYDLVSCLYPFISPNLFDNVIEKLQSQVISEHVIKITATGNGFASLLHQDFRLIHPVKGIYMGKFRFLEGNQHIVYKFSQKMEGVSLMELYDHRTAITKPKYITAYITPSELNEEDQKELEKRDAIDKDPDYIKGLQEGWSLLIMGECDPEPVIVAGRKTRAELLSLIPEHVRSRYLDRDIDVIGLDGEPIKLK